MKQFVCEKCGSIDLYIETKGTQSGLYCSDCGKWIKWLGKDELRLAEKFIEGYKKNSNDSANTVQICGGCKSTMNYDPYFKTFVCRQCGQRKDINRDKFEELNQAVQPLIEFLNKYYNPMTSAIVTEGRVDIVVNDMGMPLDVRN